jgi:UV excision repair protein RAD23
MGGQPGVGNLGQALAQNPQMLAQFLQQMGQSNPELVQQLLANPQALQQLIQSVGGDMGDEGDEGEEGLPDDFGGMEEHGGQQQLVQLTPAEEASVRRITELGFPFQRAVEVRRRALRRLRHALRAVLNILQAFLLCDRNEELAVNYLFEHQD